MSDYYDSGFNDGNRSYDYFNPPGFFSDASEKDKAAYSRGYSAGKRFYRQGHK